MRYQRELASLLYAIEKRLLPSSQPKTAISFVLTAFLPLMPQVLATVKRSVANSLKQKSLVRWLWK